MQNNPAVLKWSIDDDDNILIEEVCENHEITKQGFLKIGNFSTNRFLIVTSKKQLEEEIYDLASRFFMDWDSEISYDGYFEHIDRPIEATIKDKENQ